LNDKDFKEPAINAVSKRAIKKALKSNPSTSNEEEFDAPLDSQFENSEGSPEKS